MLGGVRLHSVPSRYGAAVAAVLLATVLNMMFPSSAGNDSHYFLFCAAVLASTLLGGTGPGLLATALSALASSYFFLAPLRSFKIASPEAVERLALFVIEGNAITLVGQLLTTAPAKRVASPLVRYGSALVLVGLAAAVKITLFPTIEKQVPFTFFYAAVVASAWYGGIGPGLMATVVSIPVVNSLFLGIHPVWAADPRGTLFGLEATLLCLLAASSRGSMRQTEERLRRVFVDSPVGKLVAGPDMRILLANPAASRMLGYSERELQNLDVRSILHPDSRERFAAAFGSLVQRPRCSLRMEEQFLTRSGKPGWAEIHASSLEDGADATQTFLLLMVDITERRRTEETLRESQIRLGQAEKMEAIGLLAAGVAHDFNNLLSVMLGYSEQILAYAGEHPMVSNDAHAIHEAATRAADLTRELLAFGRKQPRKVELLDLNSVIRAMTNLLRGVVGPDCELATDLDPMLDRVRADRNQVEQILVNLASNARDAMPEGGRLTIQTSTADLLDGNTPLADIPTGSYAVLSVCDTGKGMDKATLSHLFEPFFTTKERGRGTGLGLASVYGVVTQSGGYIDVKSEPGGGTCFTIYLPAAGAPVATQRGVIQ